MIHTTFAVWLGGLFVLSLIRPTTERKIRLYWESEVVLTIMLSTWLAIMFRNAHLLFLLFFVQWMSNMLFLKKKIYIALCTFHLMVIAYFTIVKKELTGLELMSTVIVYCCVFWFARSLAEVSERQKEQNLDHQQSLDDLLELVEVKYEEARQATHAKSSFLANMSHEIRTPINTVLGLDIMILRECKDENIRKYAVNIQSAGQSLLSIINDILDFSKIESGKMEIIRVEYDLSSVVNDVSNMISPKADDKGLNFVTEVDCSLPNRLMGDDVRVRQVLVNLLTNAVKYTHQGTVTLSVNGYIEDNELVMNYSVRDTGIGIKQEDLHKLSSEFVRIEEKRNRNIEGTGLGINIVMQLLALMGSKLEVDSVYGEGSDFHFTLRQGIVDFEPIGDLEKRINEKASDWNYEASFIIPGTKLLIVDDNPMNRLVFTELLKELECEIDEAASGKKGLELIAKNRYDIIFMDHMMPEMDGIETLQEMQKWTDYPCKDTPVIILTANAVAGAKESYLEIGFDDYLSKPVDPDKLEKMIFDIIPDELIKSGKEKKKKVQSDSLQVDMEQFPALDGVDWDYAILKLKEASLVTKVVEDFSVMAEYDLKELNNFYDCILNTEGAEKEEALGQYRIKVHAMKTTAAMFGAFNVSSLARLLEFAAKDLDEVRITSLMGIFCEEWMHLKAIVDDAFGLGQLETEEEKSEIDPIMLNQYLVMLKSAMQELDTDTADAIVEELQNYSYDASAKEHVNDLVVAVRNLDIDAVQQIVDNWN